jgi:hypothetical protein
MPSGCTIGVYRQYDRLLLGIPLPITHHVCPSALDVAQSSLYRPSSADHDRVKTVECIDEAHHEEAECAADPWDVIKSQTQQHIVDDDEDSERLREDACSKAAKVVKGNELINV